MWILVHGSHWVVMHGWVILILSGVCASQSTSWPRLFRVEANCQFCCQILLSRLQLLSADSCSFSPWAADNLHSTSGGCITHIKYPSRQVAIPSDAGFYWEGLIKGDTELSNIQELKTASGDADYITKCWHIFSAAAVMFVSREQVEILLNCTV